MSSASMASTPVARSLVAAADAARDVGQRPTGLLRLSVPRAVVPLILEPMIASFCQAYPEIELEIGASDEMVDLVSGGFDAGIRLGQLIAPDMVAVRLTPPFPFVIVGSPDYLARHGRPKRVDDLRHHACLRIRRSNGAIAPWRFVDGNKTIEAIVSGPSSRTSTPPFSAPRSEVWGLLRRQARSPEHRLLTADCKRY